MPGSTSGATFFRSIGGSFGVAIFGAVFSIRLATEIVAELRGVRLPPGFNPSAAQANPVLIHRLPAAVRGDIVHAYTLSLQTVFLGEEADRRVLASPVPGPAVASG